jgi:phosphotransferase system enzyme I (PtsP)
MSQTLDGVTVGFASPGHPARRMLAGLRDIMAGSGSPQSRLDKIVAMIAAEFGADVCSCYVMRPGEVLELFSTVGLNPEAVHNTRLRSGEGVVGTIAVSARPLSIPDAPNHPNFAYRPETGEDPFRSLMGVPILRGGKVRGVLVVQTVQPRRYGDDEVELLQTVAMVTAELMAGGALEDPQSATGAALPGMLPARMEGVSVNGGLAEGLAVLHRPQLTVRQLVAEDPANERLRFDEALASMHKSLDALLARTADDGIQDTHEILQSYRMFAEDRGWLNRIYEAIDTGLTAEAAVQRVQNDMSARIAHVTDPYLRERLLDFDDLATRTLLHLAGHSSLAYAGTLPDDVVLVARTMGPAELLDYDRERLRALVLEEGSATSHVSIIARALDIPVVVRCQEAMTLIESMDRVIVDGDNANVFVRPAEDVQEAFRINLAHRRDLRQSYADAAALPSVTRDGTAVSLNLNAGLLTDVPHLHDTGADGIGLYRTEIPFMVRPSYPTVEEQTDLYAKVLDQADGKPVIFRTLDVGGDKMLPYFSFSQENPALGWRAIRIGLDRPAILRIQLRAMLRAAAGRPIGIMFPMVTEVEEFDAARRLLTVELDRAVSLGSVVPAQVKIGVMLEVPALLWQLPHLLPRTDFVAVGSNDLLQYLFAADRGNTKVAHRYDPLSPVVLNMLAELAETAKRFGVPLSLCGEIAGRPLEAMALLGVGFRSLSMAAASLGPVKEMVRALPLADLEDYLATLMSSPRSSLREHFRAFARDHGIPT